MKSDPDKPANQERPRSVWDGAHPDSPDRDPSLPHQVILLGSSGGHTINVSCNCRRMTHGFTEVYEPIGSVRDRYDTQDLYNNPRHHRLPFTTLDEIHYRDMEPQLSVNDRDHRWSNVCWICGEPGDHTGVPHSVAMDDGLTRYDIVDFMRQGGYTWRDEG